MRTVSLATVLKWKRKTGLGSIHCRLNVGRARSAQTWVRSQRVGQAGGGDLLGQRLAHNVLQQTAAAAFNRDEAES
jgi:hypothetical protein